MPGILTTLENKYFQPLLLSALILTSLSYLGLITFIDRENVAFYSQVVHLVIAFFLAWKFHPYRKSYEVSNKDHNIIFSISFFMIIEFGLQTLERLYKSWNNNTKINKESSNFISYQLN